MIKIKPKNRQAEALWRGEDGWFRRYLRECRAGENPIGDFVRDSRRVRDLPNVETVDELLAFMRSRGACREAVSAARACWRRYLPWLRRRDFYAYLKIKSRPDWDELSEEQKKEVW